MVPGLHIQYHKQDSHWLPELALGLCSGGHDITDASSSWPPGNRHGICILAKRGAGLPQCPRTISARFTRINITKCAVSPEIGAECDIRSSGRKRIRRFGGAPLAARTV